MLNLRRLQLLQEVAHHGGVNAAARALHYSPSSVSQQLSALEDDVGAPVIERAGRGIRLTPVGHALLHHGGLVLDAEWRARTAIEQVRKDETVELAVGAFATVTSGLLPGILAELGETFPQVRVTSRETDPEEALAALHRNSLDISFLEDYAGAQRSMSRELVIETIGSESFRLVTPASARRQGQVSIADYADRDWVISGPETHYGRAVRAACREAGFEPRVSHEVREQSTALALVAAGLGVALISDLGQTGLPDGLEATLPREPITRRLFLGYKPWSAQRPATRAFVGAAKRAMSQASAR